MPDGPSGAARRQACETRRQAPLPAPRPRRLMSAPLRRARMALSMSVRQSAGITSFAGCDPRAVPAEAASPTCLRHQPLGVGGGQRLRPLDRRLDLDELAVARPKPGSPPSPRRHGRQAGPSSAVRASWRQRRSGRRRRACGSSPASAARSTASWPCRTGRRRCRPRCSRRRPSDQAILPAKKFGSGTSIEPLAAVELDRIGDGRASTRPSSRRA